jgi:hypothetical protein
MRSICLFVLLAACASTPQPVKVVTQEVVREVQRPCPVTRPARPTPLARPLPADSRALAAVLADKLLEWAGAGGYGERADAALTTCTIVK